MYITGYQIRRLQLIEFIYNGRQASWRLTKHVNEKKVIVSIIFLENNLPHSNCFKKKVMGDSRKYISCNMFYGVTMFEGEAFLTHLIFLIARCPSVVPSVSVRL
jgi:hypothetical protein